jgi:hypothetical protein
MYLQLRIIRPQYSTERICAAIRDNRTFRCALHCKFGVKYSAHRPVYSVWTVVRTSSGLRYVNCGPGHIQGIHSSAYLGFNIQV